MKKYILFFALIASIHSYAQIGATAPNFNVTDINGNEIDLYADILDQGLIAVVDVSATWCGPCWGLHTSHVLGELHELYGPNGSNQLRVIFYEGDANTTMEDLMGNTSSTAGNWLEGTEYPIVNESPVSLDLNIWAPLGFPTVNIIQPDNYEIVADTYNLYELDEQVSSIESSTGIDLQTVGVNELSNDVDFAIYPNPVQDILKVDLTEFDANVFIQVFDVMGKEVMTLNETNQLQLIDFSNLNNGNYIISISDETKIRSKRINVLK